MLRLLRQRSLRLFRRRRWSALSLEEVVRLFGTPERLDDFMQVVFAYVHDERHHGVDEHWQLPTATLALRRGDCEDWALFAHHVLTRCGLPARMLAVFTAEEGHAVCVFRDARGVGRICNEGLVRVPLAHVGGEPEPERSERLARAIADSIFPGEWTSCSWVEHLRATPKVSDVTGYVPHYRWILPDGSLGENVGRASTRGARIRPQPSGRPRRG